MSKGPITRPKADKRKIHCRNEFELCYIRHKYFRRVEENPSKDDMQPYLAIASHFAKNTFFTYRNLFRMIGFESEDLISIAQIHLVSFLGLFSLEKTPEKYDEFVKTYKNLNSEKPTQDAVLNKNKAVFTMFLKQRMEDVVRICRQKARNIKGLPTEEYYFYYGPQKPPLILRDLIDNYEKMGFRKLDTAIYKSIKKKVKVIDGPVFKFNRNYYIAVPVDQKSLSLDDFSGAGMDPYDSLHNMTPEQIYFSTQENKEWERKQNEFDNKPRHRKVNVLKKFIRNNRNNPEFSVELRAARKLLKNIEGDNV